MKTKAKFIIGNLYMTPGAIEALDHDEIMTALSRHESGDWGDVSASDAAENELSIRDGFRILSSYESRSGTNFWIITEADRSATTILLPSEY
ncbi:MAG: hypothetical protein KC940_16335 [Candidatus Omnitrophica bacterium]|nr:hypothetical protein [Candidatus Omnitrophota bacterium]